MYRRPVHNLDPSGDERRLIERTIAGDQDAFQELVRAHHQLVMGATYRAFGNRTQAEDVTQEVFFKVWQNLRRYRFEQPFVHWLHRVTSNAIADAFRRRRPMLSLDALTRPPRAPDNPELLVFERQAAATLRATIARMPAIYGNVLMLRAYHELSYEEIAVVLSIPLGTVMSRLHNAKNRLRAALRQAAGSTVTGQEPEIGERMNKP